MRRTPPPSEILLLSSLSRTVCDWNSPEGRTFGLLGLALSVVDLENLGIVEALNLRKAIGNWESSDTLKEVLIEPM